MRCARAALTKPAGARRALPVSPQGWNAARPAAAAGGGSFYCLGLLNYTPKDSSVRSREANVAMLNTRDLRSTK